MEIEIFTLCDAAADYGGKLNIMGTFDTIRAKQLPVVYPHCALALRVRFEKIEEGSHNVRINFIDEDGKPFCAKLDGNVDIKFPPDISSVCANLVLNINSMKFEKSGGYSIDLAVDGRQEKSLPVRILQA